MNSKKVSIRYIENKFSDKLESYNNIEISKLIRAKLSNLLKDHLKFSPPENSKKIFSNSKVKTDYSIYSGSGGNIYTFWRYYVHTKILSKEETSYSMNLLLKYYNENYKILEKDFVKHRQSLIPSFFQGPVGIFTMGCLISKETKNKEEFLYNLKRVLLYEKTALDINTEYEVLYGTAGYLFALLLIKTECGNTFDFSIDKNIYFVFKYLFECGIKEKEKNKADCLIFPWKRQYETVPKVYIGAIHGIFGVIYMFIKTILIIPDLVKKDQDFGRIEEEIYKTVLYLISLQFSNGNFPSSFGNENNKLIHFCHGAPGSIYTLSVAYQYFKDDKILNAVIDAGEVIWRKGLIKKGNSICHGIIGNGFVFFELFKLTQEIKWKVRGMKFALATFDNEIQKICAETEDQQRLVKGVPDTPYSLMEGQGGLITFFSDILTDDVRFPGFEIIN